MRGDGTGFALGSHIRRTESTIDCKISAGHIRRVIRGQEQYRLGLLDRLAEATHGHMDQTSVLLFLRVQKLHQKRGPQRTGAQRVEANVLLGVHDGQLAGHGQYGTLGGRVGQLWSGRTAEGDKGSGVDDGATASLAHLLNGVLAAPPDALDVDFHGQIPILDVGQRALRK